MNRAVGGGAHGPEARTGVVLSGGGAKGAFEAGVLLALAEGRSMATDFQPLATDVYTGTSVGGFHAAFLASRCRRGSADSAAELVEVWRRRIAGGPGRCGNGVFRLRLSPAEAVSPACLARPLSYAARVADDASSLAASAVVRGAAFLAPPLDRRIESRLLDTFDVTPFFSTQPLEALLPATIDLDALDRTPGELAVVASNFRDGTVSVFDQHAVAQRLGYDAILASAAIPGLFPPVTVDGAPHVDGGLLMNTPLKPAVRLGAEVIHVIYLDPLLDRIPFPPISSTLETMYRAFAILSADHLNADITIAARINQLLRVGGGEERLRKYRPITVHRFRPEDDLGGGEGLFDFSIDTVERWIEEGYRIAVEHDCRADGCVLPDEATAAVSLRDRDEWRTGPPAAARVPA